MSTEPIIMRRELINGIDILCKRPHQANEEMFVQTIIYFGQLVDEISNGAMKISLSFDEKRMQELESTKS